MATTNELREQNRNQIRQTLGGGKEYSPADMAKATGLCQATCNTILREFLKDGTAVAETRQTNARGRKTTFYRLNAEQGIDLYLYDDADGNLGFTTLYLFGGYQDHGILANGPIDREMLQSEMDRLISTHGSIRKVILAFSEKLEKLYDESYRLPVQTSLFTMREPFLVANYLKNQPLTTVLVAEPEKTQIYHCFEGKVIGFGTAESETPETTIGHIKALLHPAKILVTGSAIPEDAAAARNCEWVSSLTGYRLGGAYTYPWQE